MGGPWADLVAGERIRRTPAWPPSSPTQSDLRKFIRLWVKTLYQMARGVQDALVQGGHLPPRSGGLPDVELQLSTNRGNVAFVSVSPASVSVKLYGRETAAYSGKVAQTRTAFEWPGAPPDALHFRNPHSQETSMGIQYGDMSATGKLQPEMLYQTLAATSQFDAVVIIGNVAAGSGLPAQLRTNGGLLTWHLYPAATYPNHPAYGGSLQVRPYHN